jgi:hypothetical protein
LQSAVASRPKTSRRSSFAVNGSALTPLQKWFVEGLDRVLTSEGHPRPDDGMQPELVINVIDQARPRPFRRNAQGTFVISVVQVDHEPEDLLRAAYPVLVRSLSNLLVYITRSPEGARLRARPSPRVVGRR